MRNEIRFLCLGDNHGNAESLQRVVEDTDGESFDYVVHTGDLTNMFFDGYPSAMEQLENMEPYLEELSDRGELVYVFGNRDQRARDELKPQDIPVGSHIPDVQNNGLAEHEFVEFDDVVFTQAKRVNHSDKPIVRVTHKWTATPPSFDGLLSMSGDTHSGRYINNILDTGFLYRTDDHGSSEVYGGFFIITVRDDEVTVEFRSIGDVETRSCPRHGLLGAEYVVPSNWNEQCSFCYDEDEYVDSLRQAVLKEAIKDDSVTVQSDGPSLQVTESIVHHVESEFPREFRRSERESVIDAGSETEQTGLDAF